MSSRLVKSLNASSMARVVVSALRGAQRACLRLRRQRANASAPARTLVHNEEVALPSQVDVTDAREQEARDGVLPRWATHSAQPSASSSAYTGSRLAARHTSSAMMATSEPSAAPRAASAVGVAMLRESPRPRRAQDCKAYAQSLAKPSAELRFRRRSYRTRTARKQALVSRLLLPGGRAAGELAARGCWHRCRQ